MSIRFGQERRTIPKGPWTLTRKLAGADAAISALNGAVAPVKTKKRTMSAEARNKISLAQKKRWAKAKK
jgi:hypothetical protein